MRPVSDYSKDLRQKLAAGKTFDESLAELRASGVSILDCIASVRSFQRCSLGEAKRLVESSHAWADVRKATEDSFRVLSQIDDDEV